MAIAVVLSACQGVSLNRIAHASQPVAPQCTAPSIQTTGGTVCGTTTRGGAIHAYLGIPYGQSTAGANRWTPPKPVMKSPETRKATVRGPVCPQSPDKTPFQQSEDCLNLNVWVAKMRSENSTRLPVMVFIHGGSFVYGSGANPLYDGSALASRGVLVVTLNYRLGVLGFLAGVDGLTGNYGFLDQQLALKWVKDNISMFGGDPDRVTIFGESAGAMSVGLHLNSRKSRALFRAAIMQSNPFGIPYKSLNQAGRFGGLFRSAVGCGGGELQCLRQTPFQRIVQHQESLRIRIETLFTGLSGHLVWAPVVDGTVISSQSNQNRISLPTIMGTNRNEGLVFANPGRPGILGGTQVSRIRYVLSLDLLFPLAVAAKVKAHPRYRPVAGDNTEPFSHMLTDYVFTCANRYVLGRASKARYAYLFTHVPSYNVWPEKPLCAPEHQQVCHTFELPYVFAQPTTLTVQRPPVRAAFTPAEKKLSSSLGTYWTRFAGALSPNGSGASPWPEFTSASPNVQILDTDISSTSTVDANCDFWDGVGYNLPGLYDRLHRSMQ